MSYIYDDIETEMAINTLDRLIKKRDEKYKKSPKIIDMHTHTTFSDGEIDPFHLVIEAIEKKIGILGITDHDTVGGLLNMEKDDNLKKIINNTGIKIVPGAELSAHIDKGQMHILGYDLLIHDKNLKNFFKKRKIDRLYRLLALIDILKTNYNIIFNDKVLLELLNDPHNYNRPALAKLLLKTKQVKSINEAFQNYLNDAYNIIRNDYKDPSYEECISIILNSGGIPVLAHPKTLNLEEQEFLKLLEKLISYGLQGIEVYHSSHTKEEMEYYLNVANRYNLLVSGGSDFHGKTVKPDIKLGTGKKNNLNIKSLSLLQRIH